MNLFYDFSITPLLWKTEETEISGYPVIWWSFGQKIRRVTARETTLPCSPTLKIGTLVKDSSDRKICKQFPLNVSIIRTSDQRVGIDYFLLHSHFCCSEVRPNRKETPRYLIRGTLGIGWRMFVRTLFPSNLAFDSSTPYKLKEDLLYLPFK